ncbi:beta-1,3-galactosyltransferase 5 [Hydra vulgaris]|nr:beta-1,3-galactosyltransferase 5 [Hydra vulgaris]
MSYPRKFVYLTLCFVMVAGVCYLSFLVFLEHNRTSSKYYPTLINEDISYDSHQKVDFNNRIMSADVHEINKVMQIEVTELNKVGVQIGLKQNRLLKNNNLTDIDNIRKVYNFKNVDNILLSKLSKFQKKIEYLTDPLPNSASCSDPVFLLIAVVSQPSNYERREQIRNSWANTYSEDFDKLKVKKLFPNNKVYALSNVLKVVFIVGVPKDHSTSEIYKEAILKKDIVFGSMEEDYKILVMKTRLALKWSYYNCQSSFFLKTDDDVFVNPVILIEWLKDIPQNNLYTGWCNFNSPVVRDKNNKWYVSVEEYANPTYPPYCLGGGYLMSEDVLKSIINFSYGRSLFPMEDLYVGLMAYELKVPVRDEKSHFDLNYAGRQNDCDLNNLFLAHPVLGSNQLALIQRWRKAQSTCE